MKPAFKLQDLLLQGDAALAATSGLLGQQMAVIDCDGVEFMTPGQLDLLFAEIPEDWDFLTLTQMLELTSLSDELAQHINEWIDQRLGQVETEQELTSTVTTKGIDRILSFLPIFERKGIRLYEINSQQSVLEPYLYSSEVNGFLQTLHDEGFILSNFNWGVWLDEANQYVNEPDLLRYADLLTLQKLLTTHVRMERFNSGNLAQLIDSGHILEVLLQLATIRQTMSGTEPGIATNSVGRITATRGDITQQSVDAIVNTTNIALDIGGGVSEAIHAAAGPGLKEECRKLKGCAVGQAKITHGYNLSVPWIIHTVGPVWQGGLQQEDELLAQCYRNSLELAALCPVQSIAFPSISTGFHGFPIERAVHIAVTEVDHFLQSNTSLEKVIFVCRDAKVFEVYSKMIKDVLEPSTV
ncbi:MAG: macro domain-containing protein [Oculatellaceae cyanobacterium bins.114]|nr:macro domain-containing protein [Oculatellaceae cyanobacterium bins.114]